MVVTRGAEMRIRIRCFSLVLLAMPLMGQAADGLVVRAADALWPQWQARIAVQTAGVSAWTLSQLTDGSTASARGLQGGAVLGDYYFATPSFGAFRASGGLMVGSQGGAPLASATAGARLGLAVSTLGSVGSTGSGNLTDAPSAVPYLGLGFTGAPWRGSLAVTADLGLVAERPGAAGNVGRAVFGNQGVESALRDLRLSPVLQLGVSYRF
jgi:hypothetical protein